MTNKFIAGAVALALLAPMAAFASVNIDTLNGLVFDTNNGWSPSVGGSAGDTVKARVNLDVTSDSDVNAISWDFIGDFLPRECVQFPEITQSISNVPIEFDLRLPSTLGTHDLQIKAYGVDGPNQSFACSDSDIVDSETFSDRVTVLLDSTVSGSVVGGGSYSGSQGSSQMNAVLAALQAILVKLTNLAPTTPPSTNAKCTALAEKSVGTAYGVRNSANVVLQGFLLGEGQSIPALAAGASFGFYGSQTQAAVSNYKAVNGCI